MIHRIVGCIEGVLSYFILPLKYSANVVLRSLNVDGHCSEEDKEKYREFKKSVTKGVIIFNHPTFFDHIVIMKELEDTPRFVMLKKYMVGPLRWISQKLNVVAIKKSSGASKVIACEIKKRKQDEPLLAISPAGGKVSDTRPWFMYPFKTGAFLERPKVLPIVIHYTPYEPWKESTSIQQQFTDRLNGSPLQYTMKILDPIESLPNERPSEFAERCRKEMMKTLLEISATPRTPRETANGCIECLLSCHLFLLAGVIAILNSLYIYGVGMLIVFVTSWLYHGTNDPLLRTIDIVSNLLLIGIFTISLIVTKQYKPIVMLLIASLCYFAKLRHSIFVHIPIAFGFFSIRQ